MSRSRSRGPWAVIVLVAGVSVAGLASCAQSQDAETASPEARATAAPTAKVDRGPAPLPTAQRVTVSSVVIDSIDVRATPLEDLSLDADGALAAPVNPLRAGWYTGGTVPGEVGPAVIAGHVDSKTGPAVFYDLKDVDPGDKVTVTLTDRSATTFVVDRVLNTPKKGFPTDDVFGPTPDAQLRLITCGGPYDRTIASYVDNTVVFATALA